MLVDLNLPMNINMAKAFAAIEAGRQSVHVVLKARPDANKRELGLLLREGAWPLLKELYNPKLTSKCGRIVVTVYGSDEKFDMGSFWFKVDYLRSIVHELLNIKHSDLTIHYKRNRRSTRIEVDFSWREVVWAEDTEGLLF